MCGKGAYLVACLHDVEMDCSLTLRKPFQGVGPLFLGRADEGVGLLALRSACEEVDP